MDVQLSGISKRFGSVAAVVDADLRVRGGEVLALLGENGAGKSTLMKLLYGIHRVDAGTLRIDGRARAITSPRLAIQAGIGMVFQQSSLVPALTVRENLALALESAPWWIGAKARRMRSIDDALHVLAPQVAAEAVVARLPIGQRQLVELAKVRMRDARCVILDEPSAVLAPAEARSLWSLIRQLAADGVAVVLITHKLGDVRACADTVAVMRAGRVVAQTAVAQADDASIIQWMVGQAPPPIGAPRGPLPTQPVRLQVSGLCAGDARNIELQVRGGEILGIAGISGGGQTALAEALAGVCPLDAGEVVLDGELLRAPRLQNRPTNRLGYIPADPLRNAVAPAMALSVNLALNRLRELPFVIDPDALAARALDLLHRFAVRPADPSAVAAHLSGGNLQKLVAARELSQHPAAIVACYPTMGLDVTATAQLYESLFGLARDGAAVVWISEDLDDLLAYAHRIAVMSAGRIVQVVDARRTTAFELGAWMTGAPDGANGSAGPRPEAVAA